MTPLRELQLLEAYRRGGPAAHEALSELIRAYQRRIYSICFRLVRHRDDASDLTHDVLVKLIENLGNYSAQSKLSTWVIRITLNCCFSHLRRQKLRDHDSLDSGGPARSNRALTNTDRTDVVRALGSAGVEPLPGERIEQTQKRAAVVQALATLDIESQAILVLRDVQELDYQQLAEVLEVPIGTVKSRLFRARAALRTALDGSQGNRHD